MLQCWSAGSGRDTPLQKQGRRGVGEGFTRGRSDAYVNLSLRGKIGCPKSFVCLRIRTFHRWGGHVFIVDVQPFG